MAWKISRLQSSSDTYLTTTSLMSIPVNRPYLFLKIQEEKIVQLKTIVQKQSKENLDDVDIDIDF